MTVDTTGLRLQVDDYAANVAARAAEIIEDNAVRTAPRGANSTREGPALQETNRLTEIVGAAFRYIWRLEFTAEYASYVNDGTGPHDIEGNPLLVFYWPVTGKVMFLPRVHHPGTQPTYWFDIATSQEAWDAALNEAAASLTG